MLEDDPLNDENARERILEALNIEVRTTSAMPDKLRSRILTNLPSAKEIELGLWKEA